MRNSVAERGHPWRTPDHMQKRKCMPSEHIWNVMLIEYSMAMKLETQAGGEANTITRASHACATDGKAVAYIHSYGRSH